MIEIQMGAFVEELGEEIEGIKFIVSDYDDETVVIQLGNQITELNKKTLVHLVNSLEFKTKTREDVV